MQDVPVFGTRIQGCTYVLRPSAYALLRNAAGDLAVVRTPRGCFLPGGGAETAETPEQTVEREAREECGFIVKVRTSVGKAVQIIYSAEEREYFEKICEFVEVEMVGAAAQSEPDHQVDWLSLDQALGALTHESHRWAVDRLRKRHL